MRSQITITDFLSRPDTISSFVLITDNESPIKVSAQPFLKPLNLRFPEKKSYTQSMAIKLK